METIQQTAGVLRREDESREDVTWFRASTPDVDRQGTIIKPNGIKTETFDTNPVFMWGHDAYGGPSGSPALENVLGRVVKYKRSEEAFDVAVRWATEEENPRTQMAKNMVRGGILNAVSIGFIPNENRITTKSIEGNDIPVYEETELVEVSLVPIPANPNAVALVRSIQAFSPIAGICVDVEDTSPVRKALAEFRQQAGLPPSDDAETGKSADDSLTELVKQLQLERFRRELRK